MKQAWRTAGPGLALVVLTVLVYLPALRGGFLWDDGMLITDNSMIQASNGLYRFWLTREAMDYWPLTSTAWWLEWRLWGHHASGYHVVNVLLHALNAILVWIVLKQLKVPGAWWAALVFALHPVNVATVAWISEQKNALSMVFYLTSLLFYLKFDEEGRGPRAEWGWRWYGLSLAAFLLALLSKAAVVTLPVVLLGCVWWRRGRIARPQLWYSAPFFMLALVLGLVTIWFQHHQAVHAEVVRSGGALARLAAAGWMPWFYLYQALLPVRLNMIYPKWEINPADWVVYVPGVVLVGGFLVFWWKRRSWGRPLLFGLGYFVVTLFPVLGFFDQSYHRFSLVADHFVYYSLVGVIALIVVGWETLLRRAGRWGRYACALTGAGAVLALGWAAWSRAGVYANSLTLWQDTVRKNPAAWAGYNNLGLSLLETRQPEQAAAQFQRALQLKPDFANIHYNLGIALAQRGRIEDAITQYEQALELAPDLADAHNNLATALRRVGRIGDAISHYEEALRIEPNDAEIHYNLAATLKQAGKIKEAIGQFEQALRLKPGFVDAHYSLGVALAQTGRTEEAIRQFEEALRIKPDYKAHTNLGVALEQVGQVEDAIRHYHEALRLNPNYLDAQNHLAAALWKTGRTEEAIAHLKKAVLLNPNLPETHYNLGTALEGVGKFDEAIKQYKEAVRIKPDFVEAQERLARLRSTR